MLRRSEVLCSEKRDAGDLLWVNFPRTGKDLSTANVTPFSDVNLRATRTEQERQEQTRLRAVALRDCGNSVHLIPRFARRPSPSSSISNKYRPRLRMACPFSASLRAPRGLPAETSPLDVRWQPEVHQARPPEAHLDDTRRHPRADRPPAAAGGRAVPWRHPP